MDLLKSACEDYQKADILDDSKIGSHNVVEFRLVKTIYGVKVIVKTDSFEVFLPPRFSKKINTQESIDNLNQTKMKMIYKGKDQTRHLIEFVEDK